MTKKKAARKRQQSEEEKGLLELDLMQLDRHWVEQPRLYHKYASELAEASSDLDDAKAKLELTEAKLEATIRKDPEAYGLEKVSEKAIGAAVIVHETYQSAVERQLEARARVGSLRAVVESLEHRKRALEKLVDLHGQQYFATPRASDDAEREAIEKRQQQRARRKARSKSNG